MPFIRSVCFLLFCQLAGEIASRWLHLVVPGPVLGAALCLGLLFVLKRQREHSIGHRLGVEVRETCHRLLGVLGLLFVPAGVGVIQYLPLFAAHGVQLGLVLALSTVITMVTTVLAYRLAARLCNPDTEAPAGGEPS